MAENFWRRVQKGPECWLWTGKPQWNGYGQVTVNRRHWIAHRYSAYLAYGDLPKGAVILHTCDVKLCVNPKHLSVGTQRENMADMVAKKRSLVGETNPAVRLSEQSVKDIRAEYARGGLTQKELALRYKVHESLISLVVRRKVWQHV